MEIGTKLGESCTKYLGNCTRPLKSYFLEVKRPIKLHE
jgi:hypothetical protein